MGIGAFLLLFEALMTAEGLDPRMVYILIDCILVVALVVMTSYVMRARKQGKKLGLRIIQALDYVAEKVGCYKVSPLQFPVF